MLRRKLSCSLCCFLSIPLSPNDCSLGGEGVFTTSSNTGVPWPGGGSARTSCESLGTSSWVSSWSIAAAKTLSSSNDAKEQLRDSDSRIERSLKESIWSSSSSPLSCDTAASSLSALKMKGLRPSLYGFECKRHNVGHSRNRKQI